MSIKPRLAFWEAVSEDKTQTDNKCPKCGLKVVGNALRLRGKNWHQECFQCPTCPTLLKLTTFQEVNGKFFCSKCYSKHFINKWRYSQIIGERRLSRQTKDVVTLDGHDYRWTVEHVDHSAEHKVESDDASSYTANSVDDRPPSPSCRGADRPADGSLSSFLVAPPQTSCRTPSRLFVSASERACERNSSCANNPREWNNKSEGDLLDTCQASPSFRHERIVSEIRGYHSNESESETENPPEVVLHAPPTKPRRSNVGRNRTLTEPNEITFSESAFLSPERYLRGIRHSRFPSDHLPTLLKPPLSD